MSVQNTANTDFLEMAILDIIPNPVLVKDAQLRYIFVNKAFEDLFSVRREDLIGDLDKNVFKERQVAQCNGGDLRVLELGEIDEALETVFRQDSEPRETITRKSRLMLPDGQSILVGIMHDITEVTTINRQLEENQKLLQQQSEALARMANTDALTGCSNRRSFSANAPKAFAKYNNVGSLFLIDVDHFKRFNDTYGHDGGDAILVHLVKVIEGYICSEDDLVRLGGEEFAIVLPGATVDESHALAERIRLAIESTPMDYAGKSIPMTVSMGVVHNFAHEPLNLDRLLAEGDHCLYEAKNEGRNRVVYGASCQVAIPA